MGKESELWDDSALTNAFDDAMTKYKVMHKKEHKGVCTDSENVMSDNPENSVDGSDGATRLVKADEPSNPVLNNGTDAEEANDIPPSQENNQADSSDPERFMHTSNAHMSQALDGAPNSQGQSDYNQLVCQYYEIEEQRQKILQQLQQVGYGYYQSQGEGSGTCVNWGSYSSTQGFYDPALYPSKQAAVPSTQGFYDPAPNPPKEAAVPCCPYVCPCLTGMWPSMPACSSGGACASTMGTYSAPIACTNGLSNVSSVQDDSVVRTAMGAAERAIASIKMGTSNTSNIQQGKPEKEKKELSDSSEGEMAQSISSETDLTAVINAWYSAGFYTGKYLSEQSMAKRRNE